MTSAPRRVGIIGGGITGLSAAWHLQEAAKTEQRPLSIHLFEGDTRVGGKVRTVRQSGFIMEHGPDSFITQKQDAINLCKKLGLEDQLIPCNEQNKRVFIARNNHLHALPDGFRLLAPTNIRSFLASDLFSLSGKLRALAEPLVPARTASEDESISDFVSRRFGREILDRAAGPMLAGIYNGDPDDLGIQSTFPMLVAMEKKYGSVVKGFRSARPSGNTPPMFMSLRDGMGTLTDALSEALTDVIRLESPVNSLEREGNEWIMHSRHGRETFDAVILTTSPQSAASLLQNSAACIAAPLSRMTATNLIAVSLGFKASQRVQPDALNAYGFITTKAPNQALTACTWSSSKFPNRADEGHELVRVFLSGEAAATPHASSDDDWVQLARKELAAYLSWQGDPEVVSVARWTQSSPQYLTGHLDRMKQLSENLSSSPGLSLAGGAYGGVGLPDCIRQGREASDASLSSKR